MKNNCLFKAPSCTTLIFEDPEQKFWKDAALAALQGVASSDKPIVIDGKDENNGEGFAIIASQAADHLLVEYKKRYPSK